jgi:L-2-hydroxyglutarate oxidase
LADYDILIIGGGIVGLATAMALSEKKNIKLCVIEAEEKLAAHQTGNNSGVIHSGLYYKPGSLKAKNCVEGREAMYQFCKDHDIAHDRCGKIVVATRTDEIPALDELERRGQANGLKGLRRLKAEELKEFEPHVTGIGGLIVPETGIVDYEQASNKFGEIIINAGQQIKMSTSFLNLHKVSNELIVETNNGSFSTKNLINCGGLQSDRIAKQCGLDPGIRIVPFRGEYYTLKPERTSLVKNLIYPVPDPAFPFLGVHFTRMIKGGVEAGPNAVLSFKREGYNKFSFSFKDSLDTFSYPGFLLLASKFMKMGLGEFYRSYNKGAFVRTLQRLIPELQSDDIVPGGAGVRAQALERSGSLVDDFRFVQDEHMIHVLNAPSPAATASISIGKKIAGMAIEQFDLN